MIEAIKKGVRKVKKSLIIHFEEKELHKAKGESAFIDWFEADYTLDKLTILYFYLADEESREIVISLDALLSWAKERDLVAYKTEFFECSNENGIQTGSYGIVYEYENFIEEITTAQVRKFLHYYLSK